MYFLVFEGLDGSGKSSLMKRLADHLQKHNFESVLTREPGGTIVGDEIREIILKKQAQPPSALTELLLYQASRAQHVDLVIRPALQSQKWILCDRFTASSIAFQGGGRGISIEQVEWLNQFATQSLKPHLTILLDLSVEESKKRRAGRSETSGETEDRIESEADTFHEKVRQGFLNQAFYDVNKSQPKKDWLVLDASQSPEKLFEILLTELQGRQWLS